MISHKYKCIFIHIRKAAGSSVRHMLDEKNHTLSDGVMAPDWGDLVGGRYKGYFRFCIVRNPWERFISGWKYCWSTKGQSIKEVLENMPRKDLSWNILNCDATHRSRENYLIGMIEKERRLSQRELNKHIGHADDPNKGVNARTLRHDFMHVAVPQCEYIYQDGKFVVDFLGSLESIGEDFFHIKKELCIEASDFPVVNNSGGQGLDYRNYFDDDSRQLFYEIFKRDINLLGYDFDAGPGVPPKIKLEINRSIARSGL